MVYAKRYKGIIKSKEDIVQSLESYCIENNIIQDLPIEVIGHFGNCVSFSIGFETFRVGHLYNNTSNLGFILRLLVDLFDKNSESGTNIKSLIGTPVRTIFDNKSSDCGKCIAIGNFMRDEFIFIEDLINLSQ